MEAQKPTVAKQAAKKEGSNVAGIKNAFLVILACFVVAVLLFMFWFGHESHFEEGHPIDLWGTSTRADLSYLSSRPSSLP